MEVAGHLFADTQVVGIGPLTISEVPGSVEFQLYGAFKYYFFVHLKQQSIKVESAQICKTGLEEKQQEVHSRYRQNFIDEYDRARNEIKNTPLPTSAMVRFRRTRKAQ